MTTLQQAGARPPGPAVLPGEDGWDDARQAWNLCADQRPAAVALPASAEDVVAVVQFARDHGLRVAAQGTGHSAARLGALDDVVLVRTSGMRGVSVDPAAPSARAEAGARWADVAAAAGAHGLAGPGRLVAHRGGGRLHAGRWRRLARAPIRPGLQQRARRRDGDGRRAAGAGRPRPRARPLLGRPAAAAGASGSSPRSRWRSTRSPRSRPAHCSGPSSVPPRCWARGTSGRPTRRTRSPRSGDCCACRPCRTCRSRCAAAPSRWSRCST